MAPRNPREETDLRVMNYILERLSRSSRPTYHSSLKYSHISHARHRDLLASLVRRGLIEVAGDGPHYFITALGLNYVRDLHTAATTHREKIFECRRRGEPDSNAGPDASHFVPIPPERVDLPPVEYAPLYIPPTSSNRTLVRVLGMILLVGLALFAWVYISRMPRTVLPPGAPALPGTGPATRDLYGRPVSPDPKPEPPK
ncbi:MAG: hypothetical protein HUU19_12095 [Phycisphaerales bacterium]|nr:hypothetical protein [Phycisphaerales bacterium]